MSAGDRPVRHLNGIPTDNSLEMAEDDDGIDHLGSAEHMLMQADNLDDAEQRFEWIQTAQAHALIAITERLDCLVHHERS